MKERDNSATQGGPLSLIFNSHTDTHDQNVCVATCSALCKQHEDVIQLHHFHTLYYKFL